MKYSGDGDASSVSKILKNSTSEVNLLFGSKSETALHFALIGQHTSIETSLHEVKRNYFEVMK